MWVPYGLRVGKYNMPSFSSSAPSGPPEFTRAFRVQGMDSNSTPRFQMLPGALLGTSGKRFVVLRNGQGMTLDIGNRAVCNFTEILESGLPRGGERTARVNGDRFFRLESGTTALSTTLVATGGGSTVSLII